MTSSSRTTALAAAAVAFFSMAAPSSAFVPPSSTSNHPSATALTIRPTAAAAAAAAAAVSSPRIALSGARDDEWSAEGTDAAADDGAPTRRAFLRSASVAAAGALLPPPLPQSASPQPAWALVKGNAPPPKKEKGEKKCTNVEECQEMAERLAAQQDEENKASMAANPPKTAPGGSRYRDVELASSDEGARTVKSGDAVSVRYKVLKLGKRSYDGLSGEGTVVFSRGYGLEDDENKAGDKTFDFTVGSPFVIDALNDAVPGMAVGSTRRIAVLPQMGWRRAGKECDGGPGGSGAGGDLKTDYVVVPTATMVAEEACFDKGKLPFPSSYAQQRRMAQRFDQSLIVEVALVGIN